ncbi:MAG TPA: histidine phosphatase family protein [Pyrinomonadaceae bacterium]|nr:histidine phosphatase family protein [Pyrinomonadaceae bacterium]
MKTLFILRHAKSSWDDFNLSDFDRPLNNRGLKTAPLMGEKMYENFFQPSIIVSSPAKRAKQTAVLVKESAQIPKEIGYDERIYEASPFRLLQIVSELDENRDSAMIVGHNPGLEGLIRLLTSENQTMPTAALAVIDLSIEKWNEIVADCGKLRTLIRPKDDLKSLGTS